MIVRVGWASLLVMSVALSPTSNAQDEDQRPTDTTTATSPASEPEATAVVESSSEPTASPNVAQVDEEIESRAADDTERAGESEPPQAEPAAEIFVPSEDISEDFAVPFPVDI